MKNKLKVAIIGCGRIFTMHSSSIEVLKKEGLVELVAVCDIKKERADACAKEYNCKAYYSYQELFENEKLDAVHVCIPHYMHPVVSKYALSHGVNVLCEKPMAINYNDGVECVDIAKKNNLVYSIIFQIRFNDSVKFVKQRLDDGKLGKVLSARSILTWERPDSYYGESDWKGTWDKEGGGVVIDQAIHSIDIVNWLVNSKPKTIYSSIANRNHKIIEVEDSAEGLIKYENGTLYAFYCMNNYAVNEPIEIMLQCEKGKVILTYENAYIYYSDGTKESIVANADEDKKFYGEDVVDYWGFAHLKQIKNFYGAVLGTEELLISGEEALKIQKIICSIYESGKLGKEIEL